MVPAGSHRISRVPRYSGAVWHPKQGFRLRDCHPLWSRFPSCSAILSRSAPSTVLQPRAMRCHIHGLGSCAFARHYLRNHCYFLFLRVLRCFSSPRSPRCTGSGVGIASHGFPHSDICGSICICHSPQLFAAYHVLHRLREPQASPMRPCSLSLNLSPSVKPLLQLLDSRLCEIAWTLSESCISLRVSIMSMISLLGGE